MNKDYFKMANALRILAIDAIEAAQSGHPGVVFGMADVVTVLFSKFLKFNSADPKWFDRDRFVLSCGHGSMLLYGCLYLLGYPDISLDDIKSFRQISSKAAGHPEYLSLLGIENTSGPLGQGFGNAVGMTLAEHIVNNRLGNDISNHKIYTVISDGCMMEGISHEAASFAGHLQLKNLVVLFDNNGVSIDGKTDLTVSDDHIGRFKAYGWHTIEIDGHNYTEIEKVLQEAQGSDRPVFISCRTVIGKFMPNQGESSSHSGALDSDGMKLVRERLNWNEDRFSIPDDVLHMWRSLSCVESYNNWQCRFESLSIEAKEYYKSLICGEPGAQLMEELLELKLSIESAKVTEATRSVSGKVISVLTKYLPGIIGGSADLTPSNNTKVKSMFAVQKGDFSGSYVHYGIREHAMVACMNGMALHGGIIPYGGTFFVFTDYCRPAIRLAALMKLRVVFVMTHDSIGVGEDGPTHQPIEHLMSLRLMPSINVFRPADGVETVEAWQSALKINDAPSIIVLSRQKLDCVRSNSSSENMVDYGAYILSDTASKVDVTLLATGSEVAIALKAQEVMQNSFGIGVRVVSMPCWELFEQQDKSYKDSLLRNDSLKISIEAGTSLGWERYIGLDGFSVSIDQFGLSAPYGVLYDYFDITSASVVKICKEYFKI